MELLQLRYFASIAKYESVTAAAREFGVPQSAMSQSLARLEKELGNVRLFDRYNHRLHLNDQGRTFLEYVSQSLSLLDQGILSMTEVPEQMTGFIRVRVMENSRFVITSVAEFSKSHPTVSFSICHDFYSNDEESYDVCISSSPFYKDLKHSVPLIREPMVLAVSNAHPLAKRDSVTLSELRQERFITQSVHSSQYELTLQNCRNCGYEPRISISCDDTYYIRKYVSENMGVAIAPSVSWAGRFRENTKLLEISDPPIFTTSYLLWNDSKPTSPAVNSFCRFLKEEAGKIPGNMLP